MPTPAVFARARTTPGEWALRDDRGGLTWADLADAVRRAASAMLAAAPDVDERVAVLGENAAPTLVAHAAGLVAGVGTVATSRQLTADEMTDQWRDCSAVAAVSGPSSLAAASVAGPAAGLRVLVVHGTPPQPGAVAWIDWLAAADPVDPAGDRPARPILVYTSGTTGRARGTEVRWAPASGTAREYVEAITRRSSTPPGPHLVVGPLQHNAPLTSLRHLLAGEPVIVLGRFDARAVLETIERYRVASTTMVPTHFARLLALPEDQRGRYDVSSLQLVAQTGAACPSDVKRAMIGWFGPVLVESYGGSEVGSVSRIDSAEWLAHPGSVGRAVPPFEVVVVGGDGRELPPGETGVLGFRAPEEHHIRYHADPEKTAAAYVAPGVFTLGDVGRVDEDGFIYITDRVADMVVSGGVNLYPAESERVLAQHPDVADIAVIGVPDPDMGEALLGIVVPREGLRPDPAALTAFCRERLAAYKCPRTYEYRDALPRNAMGKVDKKALRRPYWPATQATPLAR